jgi:hypothetical protein
VLGRTLYLSNSCAFLYSNIFFSTFTFFVQSIHVHENIKYSTPVLDPNQAPAMTAGGHQFVAIRVTWLNIPMPISAPIHRSRQAIKRAELRVTDEIERNRQKAKFYNSSAWKRFRLMKLAAEPLCKFCLAKGLTMFSTAVDHVFDRCGPCFRPITMNCNELHTMNCNELHTMNCNELHTMNCIRPHTMNCKRSRVDSTNRESETEMTAPLVTYQGRSQTAQAWADEFGVVLTAIQHVNTSAAGCVTSDPRGVGSKASEPNGRDALASGRSVSASGGADRGDDLPRARGGVVIPPPTYQLGDVSLPLSQWATKLGLSRTALRFRLDRWPLEKALTKPRGPRGPRR